VYDLINATASCERTGKRKRGRSNARTGVYKGTIKRVLESLGWRWTPTMFIGQGCKIHLRASELPRGRLIVSVSKHTTAVIDGVIHDTHDPSRQGTRCVYGYWIRDQRPRLRLSFGRTAKINRRSVRRWLPLTRKDALKINGINSFRFWSLASESTERRKSTKADVRFDFLGARFCSVHFLGAPRGEGLGFASRVFFEFRRAFDTRLEKN